MSIGDGRVAPLGVMRVSGPSGMPPAAARGGASSATVSSTLLPSLSVAGARWADGHSSTFAAGHGGSDAGRGVLESALGFVGRHLRVSRRSVVIYTQFVVVPFLVWAAWAVLPVTQWWMYFLPGLLYYVFLMLRWVAFFDMILPGLPLRYVLFTVYLYVIVVCTIFLLVVAAGWETHKLAYSFASIAELVMSSSLFVVHIFRVVGIRRKQNYGVQWTELETSLDSTYGGALSPVGVRRTPKSARRTSSSLGSYAVPEELTRGQRAARRLLRLPLVRWLLGPGFDSDTTVVEEVAVPENSDVVVRVADDLLQRHVFEDHEVLVASLSSLTIVHDYHQDLTTSHSLRSADLTAAAEQAALAQQEVGLERPDANALSDARSDAYDTAEDKDCGDHDDDNDGGDDDDSDEADSHWADSRYALEYESDGDGGMDGDHEDGQVATMGKKRMAMKKKKKSIRTTEQPDLRAWKAGGRLGRYLTTAGARVKEQTLRIYQPPEDLSERLRISRVRDKHCSRWFYNVFCFFEPVDGQRLTQSSFASSGLDMRWSTLAWGVLFKLLMSGLLLVLQAFTIVLFYFYDEFNNNPYLILGPIVLFQTFRIVSFQVMFWLNKKLPQIHEVRYFSQFIVPMLFYLYYRNLFILISAWKTVVVVSIWTFLVNLVLYPVMMSGWVYWVRFVWLRRQLLHYIPPLGRFIYDEDIPYEKYVVDLVVEYYYDNVAEYSSYLVFMGYVAFLRYSYNSDTNSIVSKTLSGDKFGQLMLISTYYVVTEFIGDLLIRFITLYFLKINVSHKGRNMTILNYRTRFLFALFFCGTLMDVYYGLTSIPNTHGSFSI